MGDILITLRTFSGPNLGAEVMLPAGVYVIGTDFSCDVVLNDSGMAPRHAVLTVQATEPDQPPLVHLKPLDAEVMLEDQAIAAEGQEVAPATPWFLGMTCLSWNMPHAPRESFIPNLPGQTQQASAPAAEPGKAATAATTTPSVTPLSMAAAVAANKGHNAPTKLAQRSWLMRGGLGLVLLLLLAALVVRFPTSDNTSEVAESFRRELHQAGFTGISVAGGDGRLTVAGTVLNEQERAKIWSLARNLKYPVYMRVGVRDDVAKGVSMKLNSSGIFPLVTFPEGKADIRVAAYIKDVISEDAAFAALVKDMPDLPHIEKHVIHASQLREVLQEALDRASFRNVSLTFSTGRIELQHIPEAAGAGPTGMASQAALEKLMQETEKTVGVPLIYTIISQELPSGTSPKSGPTSGAAAAEDRNATVPTMAGTDLAKLKIAGVTFGIMRFVILDNGQRIFEGGMLPDGNILERITLNALILKKNGRTTSYPLRGTNE